MTTDVGQHWVRSGDAFGFDSLEVPPIDWVFTDPPWGDEKIKLFWRLNGCPGKPPALIDYLDSLFRLFKRVCRPSAVIFVEYGLRWRALIPERAATVGLELVAERPAVYGLRRTPMAAFVFAWQRPAVPPGYTTGPARAGFDSALACSAPFGMTPGQTILDPCCGLGYTPRLAVEKGLTFHGNMLSPSKLRKTLKILGAAK